MSKMIKYDDHLEKVLTAIFGLIGMVAILINLHLKGYSNENCLDAIKDLAGLIVVLAVFIASVRISNQSKTFSQIGKEALIEIQKKHTDILLSPRYDRDDYDSEKGKGQEYLFIKKNDTKLKVKFIPIQPLDEGVFKIYIQKGTLVYGLNYTSDQATLEEIKKIHMNVKEALIKELENIKYFGLYDIIENPKEETTIFIDFDEDKMGKRKFAKAILECTQVAVEKLKSIRNDGIS